MALNNYTTDTLSLLLILIILPETLDNQTLNQLLSPEMLS